MLNSHFFILQGNTTQHIVDGKQHYAGHYHIPYSALSIFVPVLSLVFATPYAPIVCFFENIHPMWHEYCTVHSDFFNA